jgi:hypothetical protein
MKNANLLTCLASDLPDTAKGNQLMQQARCRHDGKRRVAGEASAEEELLDEFLRS